MSKRRESTTSRVVPVDVVEEILSRLSAKYAVQCKLLSKTHLALIESPNFISKHLANNQSSNNNNSKIMVGVQKKESFLNKIVWLLDSGVGVGVEDVYVPPITKSANRLYIYGSCNGLLFGLALHSKKTTFLVWNPATQEHMVLANPQVDKFHCVGFGYDAVTKDYKLVKISGISPFCVEIWNMSTNSWSEIQFGSSALPEYQFLDFPGVLVRGNILYWLLESRLTRRAVLVSFDLLNYSFRTNMALPESANIGSRLDLISIAGSLLALSVAMPIIDGCRLYDIWVLDDHGKEGYSWTKRFSIGPFPEPVRTARVCRNGKFLMEDRTSSMRDWYFLYDPHSRPDRYFLYDPHSRRRQPLALNGCNSFFVPWSFTESLVSVKPNPETVPKSSEATE